MRFDLDPNLDAEYRARYPAWIERERRIRIKILINSPATKGNLYRVCRKCGEVCLCHEEACPNCNSTDIAGGAYLPSLEVRVRCRYRFEKLIEEEKGLR